MHNEIILNNLITHQPSFEIWQLQKDFEHSKLFRSIELKEQSNIQLRDGFKFVPGIETYAINKDGIVYNVKTGKEPKPTSIKKSGERVYFVYSSESGHNVYIKSLEVVAELFGADEHDVEKSTALNVGFKDDGSLPEIVAPVMETRVIISNLADIPTDELEAELKRREVKAIATVELKNCIHDAILGATDVLELTEAISIAKDFVGKLK